MISDSLKALFYPFEMGLLSLHPGQDILFVNAADTDQFYLARDIELHCLQWQKSKTLTLEKRLSSDNIPYKTTAVWPDQSFDLILVSMTKNRVETQGLIAHALRRVKDKGAVVIAGANKEGGALMSRLTKQLALPFEQHSKYKCRVAFFQNFNTDWSQETKDQIQNWIDQSGEQTLSLPDLELNITSIPGLYGWDKVDQGSQMLTECLPDALQGSGADFGCGYGYLSLHIAQRMKTGGQLYCIEDDKRALDLCRHNMQTHFRSVQANYLWHDLQNPVPDIPDSGLDWIVMNPPFHSGKQTDISLGLAFIDQAAESLKSSGHLYMVANNHLPYENKLRALFSDVKTVKDAKGFKVLFAVK